MNPILLSFRYSKGKGRRYFENIFEPIPTRYGLGAPRHSERIGPLLTPKCIREGRKEIFCTPELRQLLRRTNGSSLSQAKMEFLTRTVRLCIKEYEHPNRDVRVVVQSAASNCIPVLGAWVWLKKRNLGIGGSFDIYGTDRELRRGLATDVRAILGIKLAD